MNAPTEEAKQTAVDIRRILIEAVEAAIENRWDRIPDLMDDVKVLTAHIQKIEKGREK